MFHPFSDASHSPQPAKGVAASGPMPVVWLASYPRSGNTMLRTIMYQCFGIRSASVYPMDVTGRTAEQVGHIEHGPGGAIDFTGQRFRLIKTHDRPQDARPAIYILRNGREATLSYHRFTHGRAGLRDIIEGRAGQRPWSAHVTAWNPTDRPDTLLLRYEQMVADTSGTIAAIAAFLGAEPRAWTLPDRETLADGHWIVSANVERARFDAATEAAFERINGEQMRRFGYRL